MIGKHKGYIVDVSFPQFRGGVKGETGKLNKLTKLYVDRCISNEAAPKDQPPYRHSCDVGDIFVSDKLVSFNLQFSDYLNGAGDTGFDTCVNVELKPSFRILTLRDALGKKVNRAKLARLAAKSLSKNDLVGVNPKQLTRAGVLDSFQFGKKGITFCIAEGAYDSSVGVTKADVSYMDLGSQISRTSPLYDLAQASKIKHLARSKSKRHRL